MIFDATECQILALMTNGDGLGSRRTEICDSESVSIIDSSLSKVSIG